MASFSIIVYSEKDSTIIGLSLASLLKNRSSISLSLWERVGERVLLAYKNVLNLIKVAHYTRFLLTLNA